MGIISYKIQKTTTLDLMMTHLVWKCYIGEAKYFRHPCLCSMKIQIALLLMIHLP